MQPHQYQQRPTLISTSVGEHDKSRRMNSSGSGSNNVNTTTSSAANQMANRRYTPQLSGESSNYTDAHSQAERQCRKKSFPNIMPRSPVATAVSSDGNAMASSSTSAAASTHTVRPVDSPYLMPQVESFVSINPSNEVLALNQQTNQLQSPSTSKRQSKELRVNPFASSHFLVKTSLKIYSPTEVRKPRSNTNPARESSRSHERPESSSLLRVNSGVSKHARTRRATSPAIERFANENMVSDFIAGQAAERYSEYPTAPPRSSSLTSCTSSSKSIKSFVSQNSLESTTSTSSNTSLVRVAAAVAAVSKRADRQRRRSPTEGSSPLETSHTVVGSMSNANTVPTTRRRHRHSQSVIMPISINTNLDGGAALADLPLNQLLTPAGVLPLSQMNRLDIPLTLPEISPFTPFIDDRRFSEGDSQSLIDIVSQFTSEPDGSNNRQTSSNLNATFNSNQDDTDNKQENHTIENGKNNTLTSQSVTVNLVNTLSQTIPNSTHNNNNNNNSSNNGEDLNTLSPLSSDSDSPAIGSNGDDYTDDQSNIWPDAPNSTFIWDSSCYGNKLVAEDTLDVHSDYYDAISYRPSVSSLTSQVSSPTCPVSLEQSGGGHEANQRHVLVSRGRLTRTPAIVKKSARRSLVPIYVKPPTTSSNRPRVNGAPLHVNTATSQNSNNANMSNMSISVEPPTPHATPVTPTRHQPRGSSLDLDRILEPFCEALFDAHEFRRECVWMSVATNRTRGFLFPKLARVVREGIEQGRFSYNEKAAQRMTKLAAELMGTSKGTVAMSRVTPWESATTTAMATTSLLRSSSLRRARSDESLQSSGSERAMLPHHAKLNVHQLGDDLSRKTIKSKRV